MVGLRDGKVLLIAGGSGDSATGMATGQIFDPATAAWTGIAEPMGHTKYVGSAHVLPDGTVLVAGSDTTDPGGKPSAELYHPAP